ncbi:rCG20431 [Rattus norvegicus]|uniref:RCG20431 n=1 Tax=Rattus norvegicus TaxID=10116 RepID=A6JGL2_RAT|nr:rCG20431 [Rattus norvegicus]
MSEDASVTVIRCVSTVSRRAAASKCEFWLSEGRGASDDTEILAGNYVTRLLSITDLNERKAPLYLLF